MNNLRGTPRTLKEAINNALSDTLPTSHDQEVLAIVLEVHVKDFLAQKFSVAFCKPDLFDKEAIHELWHRVSKVA